MKVRIGVAYAGGLDPFADALDAMESCRFDSVWLPETFLNGTVDPVPPLLHEHWLNKEPSVFIHAVDGVVVRIE